MNPESLFAEYCLKHSIWNLVQYNPQDLSIGASYYCVCRLYVFETLRDEVIGPTQCMGAPRIKGATQSENNLSVNSHTYFKNMQDGWQPVILSELHALQFLSSLKWRPWDNKWKGKRPNKQELQLSITEIFFFFPLLPAWRSLAFYFSVIYLLISSIFSLFRFRSTMIPLQWPTQHRRKFLRYSSVRVIAATMRHGGKNQL